MKRWCLLGAIATVALVTGQNGPSQPENLVFAGSQAYFLSPPRIVTESLIDSAQVAPGGRFVLAWGNDAKSGQMTKLLDAVKHGEQPPQPTSVLDIWDSHKDKVTTISQSPNQPLPQPWGLTWSSRPWTAFQTVLTTVGQNSDPPKSQCALMKLSLEDGTYKTVASEPLDWPVQSTVSCSPTKPIVVVVRTVPKRKFKAGEKSLILQIRVYDLDGKEIRRGESEQSGYVMVKNDWLADGTHLVGGVSRPSNGDLRLASALIIDTATCSATPTTETIQLYKSEPAKLDLMTRTGPVTAVDGDTEQKQVGLWLVASEPSEIPKCLVSADCSTGFLMPDLKSLAYVSRNRLFVCELANIDKSFILEAKAAAERTLGLSKAKQIGIALSIFSKDHDDGLPDGSRFRSDLEPYVSNSGVLDGFVYTFKGGNMGDIRNPSSTELGYVSVPGGRAVLMADGSSKYVKDK